MRHRAPAVRLVIDSLGMTTTLDLRSGFSVLTGLESLKLRVVEHLRLARGEWVYNPEAGTPYDDLIFGVGDYRLIAPIVVDEVRKVEEVDDAEAELIEFDTEARKLKLTIRVSSRYGAFTMTEEV